MLEVFRDFEVDGEEAKLTTFLAQFVKAMPSGWERDVNREKELGKLISSGRQFAFKIGATKQRPGATLFLLRDGRTLKITNIVPIEFGKFSRSQYNSFIDDFLEIALPIAHRLGLEPKVTSDQLDIRNLLAAEASDALRKFSALANKSTGSSHPMDRRRWITFLILEHRGGQRIDSDTLMRWFIEEERWPETEAHDLVSEFNFARELLSAYDQERT